MTQLKKELDALARYIQRVREEIAAIDRPVDEDRSFESMGEQMDAIVGATEEATNRIMTAMESSGSIIEELRERIDAPDQAALLDRLDANAGAVFEACAFQDITGQRVSKVAKSITYVEARVAKLIELMGVEETAQATVSSEGDGSEDEKLMHGPQLQGEGLSQEDINKLFD
ncbi:MAG: hypothetical protein R3229_06515 [Alphaproteobacteria bacterium]|nr:hypothetical protein [Alphaproteobacteria bacterium]